MKIFQFYLKILNRVKIVYEFYSTFFGLIEQYKPSGRYRIHIGHRISFYTNSKNAKSFIKKINKLQKKRYQSTEIYFPFLSYIIIRLVDFVVFYFSYITKSESSKTIFIPVDVIVYTNGIHSLFMIDFNENVLKIKFFSQSRFSRALDSIQYTSVFFNTGYIDSDVDTSTISIEYLNEIIFDLKDLNNYINRLKQIIIDIFNYSSEVHKKKENTFYLDCYDKKLRLYPFKNDFTIGNVLFTNDKYYLIDFSGLSYQSPVIIATDLILRSPLNEVDKNGLLHLLVSDLTAKYSNLILDDEYKVNYGDVIQWHMFSKQMSFIFNYSNRKSNLYKSFLTFNQNLNKFYVGLDRENLWIKSD